jgi:hypothetical protein
MQGEGATARSLCHSLCSRGRCSKGMKGNAWGGEGGQEGEGRGGGGGVTTATTGGKGVGL